MQVFSREILSKVARQFYWYFNKQTATITINDAVDMIDFELGGSSKPPQPINSMDYSSPRVKSSNVHKPSKERIEAISNKYTRAEQEMDAWDNVFNELLEKVKDDREMMKFILLVFRHQYRDEQVGKAMHIQRTTYYHYRSTVLAKAAMIAIANAVIKI